MIEAAMHDAVGLLLEAIAQALPEDRAALRRLKIRVASQTGSPLIRNDALLLRYRREVATGARAPNLHVERILTLNGIRSESGIATVTAITEPYACPGRCVYCPTEARAPKSYLPNEPAVMRALRSDYDPYGQVRARLAALAETGHPTDKIELILKGGTWSFYPDAYQRTFIRRCLEAANDFAQGSGLGAQGNGPQPPAQSPEPTIPSSLEEAQEANETARCRVIGVTVETRPDYVDPEEIRRLRHLGVTRVELGVQTLEEDVLARIVRDHGTAEVRDATTLLKDAGIKVAYHLMPNLPGATPASDLDTARRVFDDPAYRPDTLKLYPCVVVETAELFQWWRQGRHIPYDEETLVELLIRIKQLVPPYVRIERVIRDIPSTSIQAGCVITNLREEAQRRMRQRGLACVCIRCRQVRRAVPLVPGPLFQLTQRRYDASGGTECFLSFEEPTTGALASLLRLRIPACAARGAAGRPSPHLAGRPHWLPALEGAALIRELHSYGPHLPLHARREDAVQHHGFGRQLVAEAERIARDEFRMRRMAVIAGVGVREYYRRLGYELHDTYMVKSLDRDGVV